MKEKCTAIVLAAGKGSRMGTKIHKQYLELKGRPVLYYALETFEKSNVIDDIILVTGKDEVEYCRKEIVDKYQFQKIKDIVVGGKERYESVCNALKSMEETEEESYVFIHDGARPFVNQEMIERVYDAVKQYRACVVGMPSKDTIKVSDEEGFASDTPDRSKLWMIQTPQVFEKKLIIEAYDRLMHSENQKVTDDAMVVEMFMDTQVKLVEGSYKNIKITTPEDLEIAEVFLNK